MRLTTGINRIGGKWRLTKTLLKNTPFHHYFLSLFTGSGIYEVNKPRCKIEVFNDYDSELINYLYVIQNHPIEFEQYRKGVFGLNSQYLFNSIKNGEIKPKNIIEKAYYFFFMNKLAFAGKPSKSYRSITPHGGFQGVNIKTTRPYTNNDNGLLTPLSPKIIERLRYVNLTCYPFQKSYFLFERALLKKNITKSVFFYADPPYPGTENYYTINFLKSYYLDLIEILVKTKFKYMLSIGGNCEDYITSLREVGHYIQEVKVKYSLDANTQNETIEYLITNYNPKEIGKSIPTMRSVEQKSVLDKFLFND